jgi:glutathione synthase/RimK-type ligase-like ATP-grasp enzyme
VARVAFLTAATMLADHPARREDHWEFDLEFPPLAAGCRVRGIELETAVWDDPALDPSAWDAFVVGTTWDYAEQPEAFLARLEEFAAVRPLFNPLATMRWNLDKRYLTDLEARGCAVVPTLWRDRADAPTLAATFDELGVEELVVKPQVGASAWRQARLRRGEALPPAEELPPGACMIQPFLEAAEGEGEYSFLFFDRRFSHCALKVAAAGDYRVQSMYGGRERIHEPSSAELALAQEVVDAVDGTLLYARVDMMRGPDGRLLLMELELVEPYLYPEQGPEMGSRFADGLARLLGQPVPPAGA